jgi:hypothetical protein
MILGVIEPMSTTAFRPGRCWDDHSINHRINDIALQKLERNIYKYEKTQRGGENRRLDWEVKPGLLYY